MSFDVHNPHPYPDIPKLIHNPKSLESLTLVAVTGTNSVEELLMICGGVGV